MSAIPAGYKQTEVGVIPEDWKFAAVSSLSAFVRNAIVGGPFGSDLVSRDYVDDGVPVIRGQNMGGRCIEGPYAFVTEQKAASLEANLARPGDVVFTQRGTLGQVSVVPDTPYRRYLVSQSQMKITLNREIASSDYFYCWFSSEGGQESIRLNTIQTGVPHINLGILRSFLVPLPPAAEQQAIAEALSDADALIESLEQLVAKKRHLKQGSMQELLTGKKRLPGFSGEWETKKLGDLGRFFKGSGVKKDETRSGDLCCIRYGEIYTHHNDFVKTYNSWISSQVAAASTPLKQGDLLFAGSGETKEEIGKCVAFIDDLEAYAGGDIVILRPDNAHSMFLGYLCNTAPINAQKASRGQGDAVVHISASALSGIELVIPDVVEQTAIAAILSDMDAEIAELETQLAKTRALKQGMMHKLLTGEIRLL